MKAMLYTDKLYIESKLILCGKMDLNKELAELKFFLKDSFQVELINADIYRQPVFKHMAPTLRLVFDKEQGYGALPVLMEERVKKIGEPFNKIIATSGDPVYKAFVGTQLSVDYYDFNYYKFQESSQLVSTYFRQILVDVESVYHFNDTLYLVYPTKELADFHKAANAMDKWREKARELIECNGYKGEYLSKITVAILDKPSIDNAGGLRNFLR